jgi:hypothetical protein
MDCRRAQDWLLQADEPGSEHDMPAELREHLRSCAVCRVLVAKMRRLEEAWKALPEPANAEPAKQAFLRRLPGYTAKPGAAAAPRRLIILHFARSRWAMAALLFLVISLGVWLLAPSARVHADGPNLVEQLVEWNVSLAQANTPQERAELYAQQAAAFRAALDKPELSAEDRQLAQELMDNGAFLAQNDDPLAAADRLNVVADQLVDKMNQASAQGKEQEVGRLARNFTKVAEQGIGANLEKAEKAVDKNPQQRERIALVTEKQQRQAVKLDEMAKAKHMPAAAQKEVRRAQEMAVKQAKKHHKGK